MTFTFTLPFLSVGRSRVWTSSVSKIGALLSGVCTLQPLVWLFLAWCCAAVPLWCTCKWSHSITDLTLCRSRDSSVSITTRYGLDGPGIESRWGEIFRTCPDRLRSPPSLLYNGYRVFPGGKGGRGVMLTTHPLLVPRLRKSWAIPPLTPWVLLDLLRVLPLPLPLPYTEAYVHLW